ncbi:MAG TPA: hypothetical protein VI142_09665 [Gaiellaceae bacterium]
MGNSAVVRIDERTDRPVARLRIAGLPVAAAAGTRGLWLLASHRLIRIDASTNRIDGETRVPSPTTSVAVGAGSVWLGTAERVPRVLRVDPRTLELHAFARLL